MEEKHLVRFRLPEDEYRYFIEQVNRSCLNHNKYLRTLVMGHKISPRPCEHHGEILSELSELSNAAQRLLYSASQRDGIDQERVDELRAILNKTWMLISEKY